MPDRLLRVFVRRTSQTPDDALVAIGEPGLFKAHGVEAVAISCVFTWDRERALDLQELYARALNVPVEVGGPACGDPGGPFVPGRFVKAGITINSRGCPNNCPWCFVPKREGKLRLLPITPGHTVQDNNVLAFPRDQFLALCEMLRQQREPVRFLGGLEAARLTSWHVEQLRTLRIREVWLAADTDAALPALRRAVDMLALPQDKVRCYVLLAYNHETLAQAEARLEAVWDAGCMPFAQLYRDDTGGPKYSREWRQFARRWQRPAIMRTMHKEHVHA